MQLSLKGPLKRLSGALNYQRSGTEEGSAAVREQIIRRLTEKYGPRISFSGPLPPGFPAHGSPPDGVSGAEEPDA